MATGENLFSHQDARNLLRYGGCGRTATGCSSTARSRMAVRVPAHARGLEMYGWSPSRCIPHGGHQMSLNIAAGLGLGGNESYPDLFQPYGGFPTACGCSRASSRCRNCRASASKANRTCTRR
jgi:hypothetical protein